MEIALSLELAWKRKARAEAEAKGEKFDEASAPSAFDKSAKRRKPQIVDPVGRQVLNIVPFRRVNFNPVCAQVRRSPMLKHLESFLISHPKSRMFTFTNGPRKSLAVSGEIREAIGDQHRRLSKLNANERFKAFGCRLQFRATELGKLKRNGAADQVHLDGVETGRPGEITAHIHSHVFATFERYLLPEREAQEVLIAAALELLDAANDFALSFADRRLAYETAAWIWNVGIFHPYQTWEAFVALVWELWGTHWDYGREIAKAREACKYPVKPSDMAAARFTPEETDALYQELFKMRLVTALDGLKTKIRFRRDLALKGIKRMDAAGKLVLQFRPDWNAQGQRGQFAAGKAKVQKWAAQERKAAAERYFIAAAAFSEIPGALAAGLIADAMALLWLARWMAFDRPQNDAERARAGKKMLKTIKSALSLQELPENQIVARLAPAPYFDRVTRPALLVWNFDGDFDKLEKQEVCKKLIEAAGQLVADGLKKLKNCESEKEAALVDQCPHQSRNCLELFPTSYESYKAEPEAVK